MNETQALVKYVKDHGIKMQHIIDKTGMSRNVISPVFQGRRTLRAGEYLDICTVIGMDPMAFYPEERRKQVRT